VMPDPILGFDHALGCRSTWSVDGVNRGDAKLCDGDEFTHGETPWSQGYTQAVAIIDLGLIREVRAVRWQAGDANWIFKADLSTSTDQAAWQPVNRASGVGRIAFPSSNRSKRGTCGCASTTMASP
jgi:hypothetical protein